MSILTKTTKTGATLTVTLPTPTAFAVALDGREIATGWLQPLAKPQGEVVAHIGGKAGFTAAEAEILEAAFRAANAPSLADQRSFLARGLAGLYEDQEQAGERQGDGSAAHRARVTFAARITAAEAALAAFDAAHPEVLAEIRAAKRELAARGEKL